MNERFGFSNTIYYRFYNKEIKPMSKKLLEESTIRQFMKLAELSPLSENFLEEKRRKKKGERRKKK